MYYSINTIIEGNLKEATNPLFKLWQKQWFGGKHGVTIPFVTDHS